jgi:hypothetical protein
VYGQNDPFGPGSISTHAKRLVSQDTGVIAAIIEVTLRPAWCWIGYRTIATRMLVQPINLWMPPHACLADSGQTTNSTFRPYVSAHKPARRFPTACTGTPAQREANRSRRLAGEANLNSIDTPGLIGTRVFESPTRKTYLESPFDRQIKQMCLRLPPYPFTSLGCLN